MKSLNPWHLVVVACVALLCLTQCCSSFCNWQAAREKARYEAQQEFFKSRNK